MAAVLVVLPLAAMDDAGTGQWTCGNLGCHSSDYGCCQLYCSWRYYCCWRDGHWCDLRRHPVSGRGGFDAAVHASTMQRRVCCLRLSVCLYGRPAATLVRPTKGSHSLTAASKINGNRRYGEKQTSNPGSKGKRPAKQQVPSQTHRRHTHSPNASDFSFTTLLAV